MIIENEQQLTQAVLDETRGTEDPRLKEILQALVTHLHAFAREVRLTEKEFDQAIGLVARLGQLTTASHNEVRLMAGSLSDPTLSLSIKRRLPAKRRRTRAAERVVPLPPLRGGGSPKPRPCGPRVPRWRSGRPPPGPRTWPT